jgi:predicted nucleotide-binding protein
VARQRRDAVQPTPRLRLEQPRATVEERLGDLIFRGLELAAQDVDLEEPSNFQAFLDDKRRWVNFGDDVLRAAYNTDGPQKAFHSAAAPPAVVSPVASLAQRLGWERREIHKGVNELRSLVERLELLDATSGDPEPSVRPALESRTVFVVHGRDEGLRESVARTLERLDFEPIILSEHPHQGRTLIEKFEAKAVDVGFAVVVLSADDYGRGPDDLALTEEPNRARQNVILELGYFMGKLGRSRVAALYSSGTELPTDIHGLGYIWIDEGGMWRFELARELAAAGYNVDFNRLK